MPDPKPPPPTRKILGSNGRAAAIRDGALVDVTASAKLHGFVVPVALTAGVHERCVQVPEGVADQDEATRLFDLLHGLWFQLRSEGSPAGSTEFQFQLYLRNDNRRPGLVTLKAHLGPGDDDKQVLTVMLPDET